MGNPNDTNYELLDDAWSSGLFGCFADVNSCGESVLCLPCQAGRQWNAVANREPNNNNLTVCCATMLCPFSCPIVAALLRKKLRETYLIAGTTSTDILYSFCCMPCVICHNARELNYRGLRPGGVCIMK
eukprot:TRINITY_DN12014_c0_g2_i1.p1 TRINITY_DN12014_c0_g2~~TRINITY_DN12014_c0_g2_i1.p1  ORF type:complete len:129 (+),score=10.28 TRINITY_DN12014_c0_g2_i1:43-429(+)